MAMLWEPGTKPEANFKGANLKNKVLGGASL